MGAKEIALFLPILMMGIPAFALGMFSLGALERLGGSEAVSSWEGKLMARPMGQATVWTIAFSFLPLAFSLLTWASLLEFLPTWANVALCVFGLAGTALCTWMNYSFFTRISSFTLKITLKNALATGPQNNVRQSGRR